MGGAKRGGSASAALTRRVIEVYGDVCWLQGPKCTYKATTKDHVIPFHEGGSDDMDNLRPACRSCNSWRRNQAVSGLGGGPVITVVMGPPAAGKSTYVRQHAGPMDVAIDLDEIARALMPVPPERTHVYPAHVRHVAIGARSTAIHRAKRLQVPCGVWIIHSMPSPADVAEYRMLRYRIVTIDPGREIVQARADAERPEVMAQHVATWYDLVAPALAQTPTPGVETPPPTLHPTPTPTEPEAPVTPTSTSTPTPSTSGGWW